MVEEKQFRKKEELEVLKKKAGELEKLRVEVEGQIREKAGNDQRKMLND